MTFKDLFITNPLLIEFKRSVRRFFGVSKNRSVNNALLAFVCVLYAIILLVTVSSTALSPIAVIHCQTLLFCFIIPANLHGAIAGERERRSWDVLLSTPVENAQIVAGKLASGIATIGAVATLLAVPTLLAWSGDYQSTLGGLVRAELASIGFGIFIAGVTMLISAFSRRAFAAQLLTYTFLILLMIVYPLFVQVAQEVTGGAWQDRQSLMLLHPFVVAQRAWVASPPLLLSGYLNFAIYLGLAAACFWIAVKFLQVADGIEGRSR